MIRRTSYLLAALATLTPAIAQAQFDPGSRPTLSMSGGVAQFDLSGTGNAPAAALRLERVFAARWLVGEVGVMGMLQERQPGTRWLYLAPEVGLQAQMPAERFRPYAGVGVGVFSRVGAGEGTGYNEPSLSGAAGVRVVGTGRLGARAELRVRGIGTGFEATTAEWTAGLSWRL